MTPSTEWSAADEDDADRWTRYQAHTGLAPDDGLVWRDRGVIIAQLTARIGELELACQKLRDDYQGALARETALRGRIKALAAWFESQPNWNEWGVHRQIRAALAASPAEDTTPAAPHAEDGADPECGFTDDGKHGELFLDPDWNEVICSVCCEVVDRPAPVADPSGDTEGGQA